MTIHHRLGATDLGNGRCRFVVWAPLRERVDVHITAPDNRTVPLQAGDNGYFHGIVDGMSPGARYLYRLDQQIERPDPASRFQPDGVHLPSQVVDSRFAWGDQGWSGLALQHFVIYELHTGTFSTEGTFDGIIPRLEELRDLGITAIEIMPVAQFSGSRNWGYDGVHPFAAQNSYGGPAGLKRLADACHQHGLAVVLDVVYNHLGPEGNYLADFAPYFTDRYRTPWGLAINFDGPRSDEVRRFFLENALTWLDEFHIDALRLDAIDEIHDFSAIPFLEELATAAHDLADRQNRRIVIIAESDLNDARVIRSRDLYGHGIDAQWSDDYHHSLHALLTGERAGYYQGFGRVGDLARAMKAGYVYAGQYSTYRQRRHGNLPRGTVARQFVVSNQNHDQVGNRRLGDRLSQIVPFTRLALAAGATLLSPNVPLLFMGEEYAESAPFQYFTDHGDPDLAEAVRRGRTAEFRAFHESGAVPDPQAESTFLHSKLQPALRDQGQHRVMLGLYRELLRLRRDQPALANLSFEHLEAIPFECEKILFVRRWAGNDQVCLAFNFGTDVAAIRLPVPAGPWRKKLDTADPRWLGPGTTIPDVIQSGGEIALNLAASAFVVFARIEESSS